MIGFDLNECKRRASGLAVFVCALALSGCQLLAPVRMEMPDKTVELSDTPFFAQDAYQCGPAALATVLSASGIDTTPDALVSEVYTPGRKGSFQVEMLAAARSRDRLPILLGPEPEDLLEALGSGYPVLVLQNLRLRTWPAWHYAVVVGHDEQRFILRSGTERRKQEPKDYFLRTWAWAGRWSVVLAVPDRIPDFVSSRTWLRGASALEQSGRGTAARGAYLAATERWPREAQPWIALANADYSQGDLMAAHGNLARAVEAAPENPVARNNLAQVLLELDCTQAAVQQLEQITNIPAALAATVQATRESLRLAGPGGGRCPIPAEGSG